MSPANLLESLGTIGDTPEGIERLRQLILQLAVRGRLVHQDPNDEPVGQLIKRIDAEYSRLSQKYATRTRSLNRAHSDPQDNVSIPLSWDHLEISRLFVPISTSGHKVRTKDMNETGRFPVVDQGQQLISGYVDDETLSIQPHEACIVFGDHTRALKFIDFDFVAGADGTKILQPVGLDPRYFYLALQSIDLYNRGYGRHYKILLSHWIPLPPLAEQHRIVARVDELMALLDELEQARDERDAHRAAFRDSALSALQNAEDSEAVETAWSRIATNLSDCITDPADIDPLRKTILQLAVRGRLVPQDPNDEPASKLVKRSISHYEMKDARELPLSWCYVRFSDFGEIHGGSTPSKQISAYWGGKIPWVSPKDMKRDIIAESIDTLTEVALAKTTIRLVPAESLIMVVRGMILIHSFPTAQTAAPVTLNQDMKAILLDDTRLLPYLHLATKGMKPRFLELVERSTHGTCKLRSERLFDELIPLPPLAEQRRILVKVNELMAICDELEQQFIEAKNHQSAFAAAAVHHLDLAQETQPV